MVEDYQYNANFSIYSLHRFPFYYWIKIIILFWIVSPAGSTFLYKRFIQPLLKEREQVGLTQAYTQLKFIEEYSVSKENKK